jgi:minor extracellular serine protease Vpr
MQAKLLFLLLFISPVLLYGQTKLSTKDRNEIINLTKAISTNPKNLGNHFLEKLPIHKINGMYYLSFVGRISCEFNRDNLICRNWLTGNAIGNVASVKIPLDDLAEIETSQDFEYLEIASKIRNQLDKAVVDMHADSVQEGIGLPDKYTGKDVYIGITDWGFDYTSPMFYDTALQQTRIIAAWDQFKTSGPHPIGFNYGTEYTTPSELLAAGSDTANIYSYATHGSHVAGIAGGSGAGTIYRGVAFDSKFLFATFLVDENAVLDAWDWMYQKANADGKRLVINMSWGLYHFGTLDGSSLLSQAISAYTDLGVVFANSGGNNGSVNFHLKKSFNNDVLKSKIEFSPYAGNANMWGQSVHAWGEVGKSFSNGLIVTNSTGSVLVESPYYSTNNNAIYIDTFLVAGADTIWYNVSADSAHPLNNKPQMRLRVKNLNTALRILLKSTAESGIVNYWNVTELTNDVGNWGMDFSAIGTGTTAGDNLNGISEPSCSDDVISVAAYNAQYTTPAGNLTGGGWASFSSIGPRYDGVMKPDISAPGVNVASSISSFTDAVFTSIGSVDFNGRTYHFAKLSGTSMASPMVAGVSALILDANPYLSARQVKEIIMQTARQDNYTGVIPAEGSSKWGAGKINAYAAVKLALQTVGLENPPVDLMWSVYPNPVMKELHFTIVEELPKTVEIFDLQGSYIEKAIVNGKVYVSDLAPGTYYIRILIDGKVQQEKFIKQ